MRLTWTVEKDSSIILRDERGAARAHVGHRSKQLGHTDGWVGHVLEKMTWQDGKMQPPGCGPFKTRYDAAVEIEKLVQRLKLFESCEFGDIPERRLGNADQEYDSGAVDRGS